MFKKFLINSLFILYFVSLIFEVDFADETFLIAIFLALTIIDGVVKYKFEKNKRKDDLILNNLPIISVLCDKKGKPQQFKGIQPRYLKEYLNKYSVISKTEDEQIFSNKKPLSALRKIETDFNGEKWYKIFKTPTFNNKGEVTNIISYCRNIQNDILEEEQKNTFIATMVHDLKNPIIAQIKMLEVLIKKDKKEEALENEEIHAQMLTTARNLFEIVMSTLDTYKYDKGEIQYDFQKCDIAEIIKEVCAEKTHLTTEENELIIEINSKTKLVKADKMHIRRVIGNIVANAVHYRKEHSKILVELTSNEENLFFKVTNQGYYIRPELQADIFNKYVSNSSKFNSLGTGLGLYISKKIIDAHNGEMIIRSTKEGLNTFGFSIPKLSQTAKMKLAHPQVREVVCKNEPVYL